MTRTGAPSMEGGMRMPPNRSGEGQHVRVVREPFNGGRHAHAAESGAPALAITAACAPSMEGGMRMPPNGRRCGIVTSVLRLQWRAACACRRIAATVAPDASSLFLQWRAACACRRIRHLRRQPMVPGPFNGGRHAHAAELPDVDRHRPRRGHGPSMEGGMRMPPNRHKADIVVPS